MSKDKKTPIDVEEQIQKFENIVTKLKKAVDDEEDSFQDYGNAENIDPEDLEAAGLHEFDPYEDETSGDDADQWLKERNAKQSGGPEKGKKPQSEDEDEEVTPEQKSTSGYSDWSPRSDYSPEESKKIREHMDQGYSHREAERLAGAHRGPKDIQSALTHKMRASQPSNKMLSELKELAGHWLGRADRHEKINADPEANPMKHAAGKMLQAHEEHSKDFNDAYNTFLNSDELKNKKGLERHKAIQAWKNDWKTKNPEYHQSAENVSGAQKAYKEAGDARKKSLQEKIDHIYSGGAGLATGMDMQEAAQHIGGAKDEEGGFQARTIMDPAASYAGNNQDFLQEQAKRLANPDIKGVKPTQVQQTAAPAKPKADVVKIIRRAAKPEQLERFNRVTSAKSMLSGNKPQGGENA